MQIIDLEEETPQIMSRSELRQDSVEALHRLHHERVSIEFPSPLDTQNYVLRSKGCVGTIVLPGVILRIRPKVPISNLFLMLEYAYKLKSFDFLKGNVQVDSIDGLFERLASILSKRVLDRARRGLYADYVDRNDVLPYVRGRIRPIPTMLSILRGLPKVDCEYEEHTVDLDDNRILAWTLYLLSRSSLQRKDVRCRVSHAFRTLSNVVEVSQVNPKDCSNRSYHKLNEDYRPLHGLCRFFLEHQGPSIETGEHDFIPFIVDMPSLFESFVAEWLRTKVPDDIRVRTQHRIVIEKNTLLAFKIDIVLSDSSSDRVFAVLDTKYKRHDRPDSSDVAQVIADATQMHTQNAILVYPSTATRLIDMPGDVHVRSLPFDLGGDIEKSGELLLDGLLRFLR